ncbi:MAG: diacylglycerol kinase [Fimbriimonadaceae bacterium]
MSQHAGRNPLQPFNVALRGLIYTFRTQRHMRFHLYVVLIVVLLGVLFGLRLREMMVLLFTISLVLVAEMFNSAIEATVDLAEPNYHPMARFAKDIAAGAVMITTIVALVVGSLMLLGDARWEQIKLDLGTQSLGIPMPVRLLLGFFLLFVIVVIGKGLGKRGTVLRGGLVSGHAAYGFFIAMAILFATDNFLVGALGIMLAAIVAQSRYEAKIHSVFELSLGATVGVILGLLLFGLTPK